MLEIIPVKWLLFLLGQISASYLYCLIASSTIRFPSLIPWCVHYVTFSSQWQILKWCQRVQKSGVSSSPEALKEQDSRRICLKVLGQRTLFAGAFSCKYKLNRMWFFYSFLSISITKMNSKKEYFISFRCWPLTSEKKNRSSPQAACTPWRDEPVGLLSPSASTCRNNFVEWFL